MNTQYMAPEWYADRARDAEAEGDWERAADHWRNAQGMTLGYNRRHRYHQAELRCIERGKQDARVTQAGE